MVIDGYFLESDLEKRLKTVATAVQSAMKGDTFIIPPRPERGAAQVLMPNLHPPKKGLASGEGRARLLHDLANIELQAMELGLRTLIEYPEAPQALRDELAELTLSEARHLQMCLEGIADLGFGWGQWPVHTALWDAVSGEDSLRDRMFIVHLYLEGSGLDAQDTLLRRLEGVPDRKTFAILKQIHREEIDHVYFGSRWHHLLAEEEGQVGVSDFKKQLQRLRSRLPKRIEPICHKWRLQAGFTPEEIEALEEFRQGWF